MSGKEEVEGTTERTGGEITKIRERCKDKERERETTTGVEKKSVLEVEIIPKQKNIVEANKADDMKTHMAFQYWKASRAECWRRVKQPANE